MYKHLEVGRLGEDVAVEYLQSIGYHIVERNKRYSLGEIDILARDGETIVIVEVKAGRTGKFGPEKQQKLRRLAARLSQDYPRASIRIDVMNVDERGEVTHLLNAVEG
ncbi:MAG: YraN family protein [Patescibacteria group bacterium]|jgi:putative endonuclease